MHLQAYSHQLLISQVMLAIAAHTDQVHSGHYTMKRQNAQLLPILPNS